MTIPRDPLASVQLDALARGQPLPEGASIPAILAVAAARAAPPPPDAVEAWLSGLDVLARAAEASRGTAPALAESLTACLAAAAPGVAALPDGWRWKGIGPAGRLPWAALGSAVDAGLTKADAPARALLRAWAADRLALEDAAAVRTRIQDSTASAWREGWRRFLEGALPSVDVTRWDARWATASRGGDRWPGARLARLRLPHLGAGESLELWNETDGVRFDVAGTSTVAPWGVGAFCWGDPVLGQVETRIVEHSPEPLAQLERAASIGNWHVEGLGPAGLSAAAESTFLALCDELVDGPAATWLREASERFEQGDDGDDGETQRVTTALRARIVLEEALLRSGSVVLADALAAVDQRLAETEPAAWVVDEEVYLALFGPTPAASNSWWGGRADAAHRLTAAGLSDASVQQRLSHTLPWATLRPRPRKGRASAVEPAWYASVEEGRRATVAVPLVSAEGKVRLGHLTIRIAPGAPGDRTPLGPAALAGLRVAWRAAGSCTRSGLPACPFEDHRFTLDLGKEPGWVDGESLALGAAIAFLCAWIGHDPAVAASGVLRERDGAFTVERVGDMAAKLQVVEGRFLVPAAQAGDAPNAIPVATVAAAVAALGINPGQHDLPQWLGDATERRARLFQLLEDIQAQRVETWASASAVPPWVAMADRVRLLVDALPGLHPAERGRALAFAALAYTHAGELADAEAVLARAHDAAEASEQPSLRALVDIAALGACIDQERWADAKALIARLDADAEALPAADRAHLLGRIRGTQARAHLHGGDPPRALPLCAAAVYAHHGAMLHERGRSRVLWATALRRAGAMEAAAEQLEEARRDIDEHVLHVGYSLSYHRNCMTFWHYESARLSLATGRAGDALRHTADGLARAEGWWPRLGLLRVRAQAARVLGALGEEAEALRALDALVTPDLPIVHRIRTEARRPPTPDEEVY